MGSDLSNGFLLNTKRLLNFLNKYEFKFITFIRSRIIVKTNRSEIINLEFKFDEIEVQ